MLTKRAQILFDKQTYKTLEEIARQKGSSVGDLVRKAVEKTYTKKTKTKKPLSLAKAAKVTYGAWKNHPASDDKLLNPLADKWSKPDEVFEKA